MEIKDIKANSGNIDVVLHVVEKEAPRTFEKFGKKGRVCNAQVKDKSGQMKLTLWNEDIDKVNIGDKIHLQNGWCSEFKGEKQLSTGKFGKIEIVEKAAGQNPGEVLSNDPEVFAPPEETDDETTPVDEEEFIE
ncbi:hypothetical protein HYU22_00840 [Candidatus Woesearchaeota archaeon]|nr:hypothetical protein [Candidatus Woesearchaeota archaeon]